MIKIILTENNTKILEDAVTKDMTGSVKHFEHELLGIRTGKAHPSMVEDIKVSCYGGESVLPLKNIATISAPEPRVILIQPWDASVIIDIERALKESDLGVTPQTDGSLIRIVLQEMNSVRREELVKVLARKLEESRISIRNVRKEYHNLIRDTEKEKEISADWAKRLNELLQKLTDKFIAQVEQLSSKKEIELKS